MKNVVAAILFSLPFIAHAQGIEPNQKLAIDTGINIADTLMSSPVDQEDVQENGSSSVIARKCGITFSSGTNGKENKYLSNICIQSATEEDEKNFAAAMKNNPDTDNSDAEQEPPKDEYLDVIDVIASANHLNKSIIKVKGYVICKAESDTCIILNEGGEVSPDEGVLTFTLSSNTISDEDRKRLILCTPMQVAGRGITEECKIKMMGAFGIGEDDDGGKVYAVGVRQMTFDNPLGTLTVHF